MTRSPVAHATLKMNGRTFVLVPKDEYRELVSGDKPAFPPANEDGTYPAIAAGRVVIARTIIGRREAAGLSQKALAQAAGVRAETLNRIEKGRVTADTATIAKIDRALKIAEKRGCKAG